MFEEKTDHFPLVTPGDDIQDPVRLAVMRQNPIS